MSRERSRSRLAKCGTLRGAAFTLIELLVVVSIIALLIAILLPSLTKAREQARSAKCLGNWHAMALATMTYAADQRDSLPGPLHPSVFRSMFDFGTTDRDKQKTLVWLLRPYFQSTGSFKQECKVGDELSRCPTAAIIAPDRLFDEYKTSSGGDPVMRGAPFSGAINSWGMNTSPMPTGSDPAQWYHTDPPLYFGCWYYLDQWPTTYEVYSHRMWKPKGISQIRFASAEWMYGDAWCRMIPATAPRPGSKPQRRILGTFPTGPEGSAAYPIPSAPYHGVPGQEGRPVSNANNCYSVQHPVKSFKGWTNLSYFDGHAASFRGQWLYQGQGGTVNPYWASWGGKHTSYVYP